MFFTSTLHKDILSIKEDLHGPTDLVNFNHSDERQAGISSDKDPPFTLTSHLTEEHPDRHSVVFYHCLLVMELQLPATPGIPKLITDLTMCEPLSIICELSLRSLIHPDQMNRLLFHPPDRLYKSLTSKPAIYQHVIDLYSLGYGTPKHPQCAIDFRKVCFPGTIPEVAIFLFFLAILLLVLLPLQAKRFVRILSSLPVQRKNQRNERFTIPVTHSQQLIPKNKTFGYMIIDPGYLLNIPARLRKVAIIEDQALGAVTLFTTGTCQLNELHSKQPKNIPPAYSRVILHAVEYILFCLDML